ncbi:MAG: FMN-binding protein [Chitinispirillaceae bacterium]|nr:FMN-binding protein [Chitinispirillaceae bacterium]
MNQPTSNTSLITLAALFLFFSLLLAGINIWTGPHIAAWEELQAAKVAENAKTEQLLQQLFPTATSFEKLGSTVFHDSTADYFLVKAGPAVRGYAIHGFGKGYQSTIHAVVGINPDFSIKAVRMVHEAETEGFGTRLRDKEFLRQFEGKDPETLRVITQGAEKNGITALTAATISSRALAEDAVRSAALFLKNKVRP